MFTKSDIAEYYNTTQNHYEKWWKLKQNLSLHYGIWEKSTKNFDEALINTNKILLILSGISESDNVLDAGCGVGGAAFFINQHTNAKVTGISLSDKQISLANAIAHKKRLDKKISFHLMDYTNTTFANESFDVIWACESICHATDKSRFIEESYRLLKKGGRLIIADFFKNGNEKIDNNNWLGKWQRTWAVPNFANFVSFKTNLKKIGFGNISDWNYTSEIWKSSKRLYYTSILGAVPSILYNTLHPKVSRFAKIHYKCGYYQFKALKANLWSYNILLATK